MSEVPLYRRGIGPAWDQAGVKFGVKFDPITTSRIRTPVVEGCWSYWSFNEHSTSAAGRSVAVFLNQEQREQTR